jgi:hypothetical protein
MGILIVLAVVWLCVRLAAIVKLATAVQEHDLRWPDCQDAPLTPTAAQATGPQDVRSGPQDVTPADTPATEVGEVALGVALAAAVWRELSNALRELAVCGLPLVEPDGDDEPPERRDPHREWVAALRTTILDAVSRPSSGPACLGGRDDEAYLRGWDDAVDWVSQGRDAQPPTWGDIAYMTGWNDAVRCIAAARRVATAWPTPAAASRAA